MFSSYLDIHRGCRLTGVKKHITLNPLIIIIIITIIMIVLLFYFCEQLLT